MKRSAILSVFLAAGMLLSACSAQSGAASSAAASAASSAAAGSAGESQSASASQGAALMDSFTTQDLNGNTVDASILKGKKLTMVNVWTTYCGYCLQEMPDLAELNKEYADKGFQVIGIAADTVSQDGSQDKDQIELAKSIVEKTGANYTHLLPSDELRQKFLGDISSVPTTFFVDEQGRIVGYAYLGARSKADWSALIDKALAEVQG